MRWERDCVCNGNDIFLKEICPVHGKNPDKSQKEMYKEVKEFWKNKKQWTVKKH